MKKDKNKLYLFILFLILNLGKCQTAWAFDFGIITERKKTAAVIGMIILIGIAYAAVKIYRKMKYGGKGWAGYTVEDNDNILDLSLHYGVDWRTLAKTNNIEPPYVLRPGQNMLVPHKESSVDKKIDDIIERKFISADADISSNNQEIRSSKKIEVPVPSQISNVPVSDISSASIASKDYESEINGKKIALENMFTKQHEFRVNVEKQEKEQEKPQSKMIKVLIAIIFTLLVSGGAFYYWKNKNNSADQVQTEAEIQPQEVEVDSEKPAEEPKEEPVVEPKEEPKPEIKPGEINIKVLNLGAPAGSAGKTKDFLVSKNYTKTEAGNGEAENVKGATIYYKDESYKKEAEIIQKLLKDDQKITTQVKTAETSQEKSGDIVIILGK
jgi:hypothetical protein